MSLKSNIGHQGGHLIRAADEATNDIHTDGIVNNSNWEHWEEHLAKAHKEDMDVAMQQQVEIETSSLFQPKLRKLKASMEKACSFIVMLLRHFFSLSAVQK